jgi:hypothetical protein
MRRRRGTIVFSVLLLWLAGCGGGGGLGLSGGSVPLGGRAIAGVALLPDSSPAANAAVSIRTLATGATVQTAITDAAGRFAASGVPATADLNVVVQQPTVTLQAVVPQGDLAANPGQPLDIGQVTAISTVVSEAIQLQEAGAPEDAGSVVADQAPLLTLQAQETGYSTATQDQLISSPAALSASAAALLLPTANRSLARLAAKPNPRTAGTALTSLLGYLRSARPGKVQLTSANRSALIGAQLASRQFTPDAVAAALNAAGAAQAGPDSVSAASVAARSRLPALADLGPGISAYEALAIAADAAANGGFQLDRPALDAFVTQLMSQ